MKITTQSLICATLISILTFISIALTSENLQLVVMVFTVAMVIIPFTVYKVLIDGKKLQQQYVMSQNNR